MSGRNRLKVRGNMTHVKAEHAAVSWKRVMLHESVTSQHGQPLSLVVTKFGECRLRLLGLVAIVS